MATFAFSLDNHSLTGALVSAMKKRLEKELAEEQEMDGTPA